MKAHYPTYIEIAKRLDPKGQLMEIAEILAEENSVTEDMVVLPCNKQASFVAAVRDRLPTPDWVATGEGVDPKTSTVRNLTFSTGKMRMLCEIPKDAVEIGGNSKGIKYQEEKAFVQAMNIEMADTVFYGDEGKNPREFNGLSRYYNKKNLNNNKAIHDAGGTGSRLRSIWIVDWDPMGVHGIYPEDVPGGIQRVDLGNQMDQTAPLIGNTSQRTGRQPIISSYYDWSLGLVVKNWGYASRICNIDLATLTEDASTGANLHQLIRKGMNSLKRRKRGMRTVAYAPREILDMIDGQAVAGVRESQLEWKDLSGRGIWEMVIRGIPFKLADALDTDEARVT